MKSKSKDLKKTVPDKNASLERVINRNEKIKETVKQAANELTSVNEILKEGKEVKIPLQIIQEAITQNKEVEYKVAKVNHWRVKVLPYSSGMRLQPVNGYKKIMFYCEHASHIVDFSRVL